jgi:hypothetical protein
MLKGKRKLALIPVILIIGFEGYSMAAKPPPPKLKIKGTVYELPESFLLNLSAGRYAKIDVALLLAPGQSDGAAKGSSSGGEGEAGTLPEEPVVRAIVTNAITGRSSSALIEERGRLTIEKKILKEIAAKTDVEVEAVIFPDLTVQ